MAETMDGIDSSGQQTGQQNRETSSGSGRPFCRKQKDSGTWTYDHNKANKVSSAHGRVKLSKGQQAKRMSGDSGARQRRASEKALNGMR
jgi:hypothetical protein